MHLLISQEYNTSELPTGFLFKIIFLSTWGDVHYVGLNGIEIYDHKGDPVLKDKKQEMKIFAEPPSVC